MGGLAPAQFANRMNCRGGKATVRKAFAKKSQAADDGPRMAADRVHFGICQV
jgi:hypothetical protein